MNELPPADPAAQALRDASLHVAGEGRPGPGARDNLFEFGKLLQDEEADDSAGGGEQAPLQVLEDFKDQNQKLAGALAQSGGSHQLDEIRAGYGALETRLEKTLERSKEVDEGYGAMCEMGVVAVNGGVARIDMLEETLEDTRSTLENTQSTLEATKSKLRATLVELKRAQNAASMISEEEEKKLEKDLKKKARKEAKAFRKDKLAQARAETAALRTEKDSLAKANQDLRDELETERAEVQRLTKRVDELKATTPPQQIEPPATPKVEASPPTTPEEVRVARDQVATMRKELKLAEARVKDAEARVPASELVAREPAAQATEQPPTATRGDLAAATLIETKAKVHSYGPPTDVDPEAVACKRKFFEAVTDARLRVDSDASDLELRARRAAKQATGVTVYGGPFEVEEEMLLSPDQVARHVLTTADISEPTRRDTTPATLDASPKPLNVDASEFTPGAATRSQDSLHQVAPAEEAVTDDEDAVPELLDADDVNVGELITPPPPSRPATDDPESQISGFAAADDDLLAPPPQSHPRGSKTPTRLAKKLEDADEDNGPSDPEEVVDQSISESVTSSPAKEGLVVNYTSDLEEGEAEEEEDEGEDSSGALPPPSPRSTATAAGPISEPLATQTVAGPENAAETVAAARRGTRPIIECLTPRTRVWFGIDVAGTTGAVQAAQQRGLRPRQPPPLSRGPPPPPRAARVPALVESQDSAPLDVQAGTDLETAGTMPPVPAPTTNVPPTPSTPPATPPATTPPAPDDGLEGLGAVGPTAIVGGETHPEATGSDSSSDESEELVRMTAADERRLYSVDALTERFHEKRSVEAAAPVVVCDEVTALKVALTHQSLLSKGGAASLLSHAVLLNMYNCKKVVEYHRSWMTGVFDLLSADGSACQKAFLEKKRAYEKEMGNFLEFKRDLGETARKTVAAFNRAELCKTRVTKHFLYAIQKAVARKFGKAGTEPYRLTVDVLLTQGLFDREGIDDGWDRISWKTRKTFAEALMSRPRKEHHALMVGMRFLAEVRPGLDPLVLGEDPTDSFNIRLHEAIKKYKAEISD